MRLKTASQNGNAYGIAARGNACNAIYKETHAMRLYTEQSGRLRNILFFDNYGAYFIEYVFYSWYFRWNYLIGCVFVVWKRRNFMMMRCIIITKLHLTMLI